MDFLLLVDSHLFELSWIYNVLQLNLWLLFLFFCQFPLTESAINLIDNATDAESFDSD